MQRNVNVAGVGVIRKDIFDQYQRLAFRFEGLGAVVQNADEDERLPVSKQHVQEWVSASTEVIEDMMTLLERTTGFVQENKAEGYDTLPWDD